MSHPHVCKTPTLYGPFSVSPFPRILATPFQRSPSPPGRLIRRHPEGSPSTTSPLSGFFTSLSERTSLIDDSHRGTWSPRVRSWVPPPGGASVRISEAGHPSSRISESALSAPDSPVGSDRREEQLVSARARKKPPFRTNILLCSSALLTASPLRWLRWNRV